MLIVNYLIFVIIYLIKNNFKLNLIRNVLVKRSSENNIMKFYIVLVKYILFKFINNFYLIELGFLYRDKNVFFFMI